MNLLKRIAQALDLNSGDFQPIPHSRENLSDFRNEAAFLRDLSANFATDEAYAAFLQVLENQFGPEVAEMVDKAPSADWMHYQQHQSKPLQEMLRVFPMIRRVLSRHLTDQNEDDT